MISMADISMEEPHLDDS